MTTHDGFIEGLCRAHERELIGYLTQILGTPELAREVAEDALEKLHKEYRPDQIQFPRAALFTIATRVALLQLRRRRIERRPMRVAVDMTEEEFDHSIGPDRQAIAVRVGQQLATAIKELRPTLRDVFVMAHLQGKPRTEIAAALGISEKRVDRRMTKALRTCRERLISQGIDLANFC